MEQSAGTQEILVLKASAQTCFDIVFDFAKYPAWLPEFHAVRIVDVVDENTRDVEFTFKILLKKIRYTIRAVKDEQAMTVRWSLLHGEFMDANEGGWLFEPLEDGTTRVTYDVHLSIDAPVSRGLADKVANTLAGTTLPRTMRALEKRASSH